MAEILRRAETGRPVSRLVSPIITRLTLVISVLTAICVLGLVFALQSVTDITGTTQPSGTAQAQYFRDLTSMETSANAYVRSRQPAPAATYRAAAARLGADADALVAATKSDTELALLADAEIKAGDAWVHGYGNRVVVTELPSQEMLQALTVNGRGQFATFTSRRDALQSELDVRSSASGSDALLQLRVTIVLALLLFGMSWVLVGRSRTKLLRQLSEPLTGLEKVVARMLRNDPEGRADQDTGPKEVRAIARALNDFADAQSRARAVEGRIQDELHVLDSAKDDFVSNVSHELRTPLTTISGYLEMVADEFEGRLEPRHDRMLEATRRNVIRLRALIDDLLALSKAETRPSELEPADVTSMVRDAVTDVRMTAARRGITLDFTAPDEQMLVVSDRAMLYRAFLNVLTNAVKFSHERDTVEVSVTRVQNRVEIAVSDHGIGIPRSELDRLGTRFFRASNAMTNEIAGTGLGLRIVQTIIDKHAGDVIIESAEGEGTTVFIRLRLHGERVGRLSTSGALHDVDAYADETVG